MPESEQQLASTLNTEAFYPHQIVSSLSRLVEEQPDPARLQALQGLPPPTQLLTVISQCYVASLMQEEGRSLQFSVVVTPWRPYGTQLRDWLYFNDSHHDFSAETIRRLAPAASPDKWAIALHGSPPMVVGTVRTVRIPNSTQFMASTEVSLGVRVYGPGHMDIWARSVLLLRVRPGVIETYRKGVWRNNRFIDHMLSDGTSTLRALCERVLPRGGSTAQMLHDSIRLITGVIQRNRHGGTLLFVKAQKPRGALGQLRPKYLVDYRNLLRLAAWDAFRYKQKERSDRARQDRGKLNKSAMRSFGRSVSAKDLPALLDEAVRLVAGLANVDGAVVLDSNGIVLGFGAEILGSDGPLPPIEWVDLKSMNALGPLDFEKKGMRHRSALRFCGFPQALGAIVVSADGSVTLMMRQGEKILVGNVAQGEV